MGLSHKGTRDASACLFGPLSDVGINIGAVVFSELLVKVGVAEMAAG